MRPYKGIFNFCKFWAENWSKLDLKLCYCLFSVRDIGLYEPTFLIYILNVGSQRHFQLLQIMAKNSNCKLVYAKVKRKNFKIMPSTTIQRRLLYLQTLQLPPPEEALLAALNFIIDLQRVNMYVFFFRLIDGQIKCSTGSGWT